MHRLLVLYPEPHDSGAFIEYYTKKHLPLAAQLPDLIRYRYSTGVSSGPDSSYRAVFEGDFPDATALKSALASPAGQAVLKDVPKYATGGVILLDYPLTPGPPPQP